MKSEDSSEIITSNSRCQDNLKQYGHSVQGFISLEYKNKNCYHRILGKLGSLKILHLNWCDWNGVSVKTQGLLSSLFSKDD